MVTPSAHTAEGSALFGRTRRAILALLYGHPERAYYLREIVRATGLGLGPVQRELAQLTAARIITRSDSGHQVYFRANTDSPIFADLKNLIAKTAGAADAIREALLPLQERVALAFVFGSVARGEETRESDIDVLVVGDVSFAEAVRALRDAHERLEREVNPSVYPLEEFKRRIEEQHYFLREVLSGPKLFVVGDERELERLVGKGMAAETQA